MTEPTETELFFACLFLELEEKIEDPSLKVQTVLNSARTVAMKVVSKGEDNGLLMQEGKDEEPLAIPRITRKVVDIGGSNLTSYAKDETHVCSGCGDTCLNRDTQKTSE